MNTGVFLNAVNNIDFNNFKIEFIKQNLSEIDKQNLLVAILENGYNYKNFNFYKLIFDLIIDRRLNLNFIANDILNTPFLIIIVDYAPCKELFEYFIDRGAKINFYDTQSDEPETCLDFLQNYIEDTLVDDLSDGFYFKVKSDYGTLSNDKLSIDKENYDQLIIQSTLLYKLRNATILRNYIIATGGKMYRELNQKK